jgi:Tfp pilus assembly protein PilP
MRQIFVIFFILPTFIYAAYNPFFSDTSAPKQKKESEVKIIYKKPKPKPIRTDIAISYFGFIESNKGKFALVNIGGKNIVLKQNDSLYIGEQVVKVVKLSSNYIILKDGYNTPQTIYFSSKAPENNYVR